MLGLNVRIKYEAGIDELTKKYCDLSFLKTMEFSGDSSISWNRNNEVTYDIQVIFIGKTGYGKSTTLNSIVGNNVFETNDITSCTKEIYSAEYRINDDKPHYFSLCDFPGVGESVEADKKYLNWYKNILQKSNCVVYILRADQRDFTIDTEVFSQIFENKVERSKVIIALNYADKVEPINRKNFFQPSEAQLDNLKERVNQVSKIFDVPSKNILYYSAKEAYNIQILIKKIRDIIQYRQS